MSNQRDHRGGDSNKTSTKTSPTAKTRNNCSTCLAVAAGLSVGCRARAKEQPPASKLSVQGLAKQPRVPQSAHFDFLKDANSTENNTRPRHDIAPGIRAVPHRDQKAPAQGNRDSIDHDKASEFVKNTKATEFPDNITPGSLVGISGNVADRESRKMNEKTQRHNSRRIFPRYKQTVETCTNKQNQKRTTESSNRCLTKQVHLKHIC